MSRSPERKIYLRRRGKDETSFQKQILRGFIRLCVVGVALVLIWYGTRLNTFSITAVTVSGGETISHEEVRGLVERELEGTYFLIVPKKFTYLYPESRIREVLEKIPRIHDVVFDVQSRTTLAVSFSEYAPHALWCPHNTDNPCFFTDVRGYAFSEAPRLNGGTLVRHSIEGIGEITAGNSLDEMLVQQVDIFLEKMKHELNLRASSVLYKSDGDIEFHVNGGGMILINKNKNFDQTFDNLKTVLSSEEFLHIAPGNFRYVDVRFDNKIFVNEELEPEPILEVTSTESGTEDDTLELSE